jgi:hypothetical protein
LKREPPRPTGLFDGSGPVSTEPEEEDSELSDQSAEADEERESFDDAA